MSYTLTYISQKAKYDLLSCPNYRSKIGQFSKPSTDHCPCEITKVELPLNEFFMQLLQPSAYKVFILFFLATFSGKFWYKNSSNYKKKWSHWNCHTKPIVELPLAEWGRTAGRGSAAVL